MTGQLSDVSRTMDGKVRVTFTLTDPIHPALLDEWNSAQKLTIDVKKYREKRSMNANAYAWVLIGKLSAKLGITPLEVYRQAIQDIGDNYEVVCVQNKAVDRLINIWQSRGMGWITKTMGSLIEGCTCVFLYYGSSSYDTAQMSRLINVIVEEAKQQGIQTATPDELQKMVALWNGE